MTRTIEADICVIGAGSGGLSVAAGASQMGASVVLIEKSEMGGDCLNSGCVPSKALLAAAKQAQSLRKGAPFGVAPVEPLVDWAAVRAHVRSVIDTIAPVDSQERFEGLGCTVLRDAARFLDAERVQSGETIVKARRFVIATGSRAALPPVPGLADTPHLTNETVFDNPDFPEHLIVIGGGPIGMEMAQAHRRLGARVTVLEAFKAMGKDDPELAGIVLDAVRKEGVDIREGVKIARVEGTASGPRITFEDGSVLEGSHLLVAAGRAPTVEGLDLDKAGIAYDKRGIKVNDRLRTNVKTIYAMGDVTGGLQFTHMAGYQAGIIIRNILFRLPARQRTDHIPWATYTDPELAQVGLTQDQAKEQHGDTVRFLEWSFEENDRAQAELRTEGRVKAVTDKRGRILGASIVGNGAGELIQPWAVAIAARRKIGDLANYVAPYPTYGEVSKRTAGSFYTPKLFSPMTRTVVGLLAKLG